MHRRHVLPVTVLLALAGLTGCSNDSTSSTSGSATTAVSSPSDGSTSASPSPSTSTSTSPSTSPSPSDGPTTFGPGPSNLPTTRIEAASLHNAYLGSSAASTAEEEAVVTAWMQYWQGTADTYYLYRPTAQFEKVARGSARTGILDYLADQKKKKQRVAGWARDNVTSVKVTGGTATVEDCTENFTFSVDSEAEPATNVVPFYAVTGTLRKTGGQWTVTSQKSKDLNKTCLG